MSAKQYPALETYLTRTAVSSVSYLEFLESNRSLIVKTPPLTEDWRGLNGAWYNRYLQTSKRLNLPPTVLVAEEDTRSYWEGVIDECKKAAVGENVGDEIVDECQQSSKRLKEDEQGQCNGTLNIESKKRKSTEIDKSDSTRIDKSDTTKIDKLNATNITKNNEDICDITDGEQVEKHNLEKSWEFEQPIPDWLRQIHQHRENLTTKTDLTDFESLSRVTETESLLSNLPLDWEVLEPPVERCLHSIARLDKKGLKKTLTTANKVEDENPFLDSPPTEITTADNVVQDGDYKHPDVCYIIELLRYTHNMIDRKIPQQENSERDIDVIFKSHLFSCFDDIMDSHFGEMVSRASQQRHTQAVGASDKAEGYHLDWLFTKHNLAKDLTWGREFSLCERAGSKIENGGGGVPVKVIQAFRKLLLPGFISSRFFIRILLNVYIGGKYHGSIMLAEFDVPTQFDEMSKIVTIARMMLNVK
ncbi:5541_t:CDS:10, partial [Paraglomus brasilianum]